MNKCKLGFVDHSFHKKTRSADFFRDILAENFEITDIFDESWSGGAAPTVEYINSQNFEYVLFFQSLLPISELKKIKAKMIWVPMYDGVVGFGNSFWRELSTLKIKIISFSAFLANKLEKYGLDCLRLQYFPNPASLPALDSSGKLTVFFWQRHATFNFNDLKKILSDNNIGKVILRNEPDPGNKFIRPSEDDMSRYNIEIIDGDIGREKHLEMLKKCDVFVSPRKFEGIGMAFIEAMTMGLAVIAFDFPTMNEYIEHNKNGYLFSSMRMNKIDLSNFEEIGENAKKYCADGFSNWERNKSKVVSFILEDFKDARVLSFLELVYVKLLQIGHSIFKKMISMVFQFRNIIKGIS